MFYQYENSLYFGQISGTIKGLPTKISLPSGEKKQVSWGVAETDGQRESMMVGHDMGRNTAVDVTVAADAVTEEQAYTAQMVAVFSDGSRRERRVEGIMQRRYLDIIRPEFSKLYEIRNVKKSGEIGFIDSQNVITLSVHL